MELEKFISEGDTFTYPVCNTCKYHFGGNECAAFKAIPDAILEGRNSHSKPTLHQNNKIVYAPAPIKNGWEEVERAPAGSSTGGQWTRSSATDEEIKEVLHDYQDEGYRSINGYLRQGAAYISKSPGMKEELLAKISAIDKYLEKQIKNNKVDEDTVYRGIWFRDQDSFDKFSGSLKIGQRLADKGFVSTSYQRSVATDFSNSGRVAVICIIESKKGVSLYDIDPDRYDTEEEVLFRRNTKFEVTAFGKMGKDFELHLKEID